MWAEYKTFRGNKACGCVWAVASARSFLVADISFVRRAMAKLEQFPPLPIDLDLAAYMYPALEISCQELDGLLTNYREIDYHFWQSFLKLFENKDLRTAPDDRIWTGLTRLRNLAASYDPISGPIYRLAHNNDRAVVACHLLALLLKS